MLVNPLLTYLSHIQAHGNTASSSSTTTVLLNTLWTINALVKEWRTVKVAAGAEVMRMLEEVFLGPVSQILQLWADRERAGQADWVMSEAGRYAFKYVGSCLASLSQLICRILARFSQWHWSRAKMLQALEGLNNVSLLDKSCSFN